jgi:cellulose synthase/poly-beta-1,6-N-acetylglucosamine synthase-like glycosyltransferase
MSGHAAAKQREIQYTGRLLFIISASVEIWWCITTIMESRYYYDIVLLPLWVFMTVFFVNSALLSSAAILLPGAWLRGNSEYFLDRAAPLALPASQSDMPPLIIQIPVYKEPFREVILPTLEAAAVAARAYAEETGSSAIILVNDDGLAVCEDAEVEERKAYYTAASAGLIYTARPAEGRRGKFKKAGNLNWGLAHAGIEDLSRAVILLLDCDSRLPASGLSGIVAHFVADESIGFIQMQSKAMVSSTGPWDILIRHFTDNIYSTSFLLVSGYGDPSPLVGHNVFMRFSALQDVSIGMREEPMHALASQGPTLHIDTGIIVCGEAQAQTQVKPATYTEYFSESHVSEDFDVSMRLQIAGYKGMYCTAAVEQGQEFEEGVTLSAIDEIIRLKKYAYGVSELLMNPIAAWHVNGLLGATFKRYLLSSAVPLAAKWNVIGYAGTYYAIAAAPLAVTIHYFAWVFCPYWRALYVSAESTLYGCIAVFSVITPAAVLILKWKLGMPVGVVKELAASAAFGIFFAGLGWHLTAAICSHLLGLRATWGSTTKGSISRCESIRNISSVWPGIAIGVVQVAIIATGWALADIRSWQAIVPIGCSAVAHILVPILGVLI